jgi:twitching motility protein PilJ/methyl-accepting chemotaxis protein PixJ
MVLTGTTAYFTASQAVEEEVISNDKITATDLLDKLEIFISERYGDIQVLSTLPSFTNAKLRKEYPRQDKDAALDRFVKTYQFYDSIALLDLQGNVLAQSQGEALPNLYNQDFFQEVLKTDRPYISEPQISIASKIYSLFIAAPVKDQETGKTIAIIRTRLPMTALQDKFGITTERGQHVYLFGEKDEFIASDVPGLAEKKQEEQFPQLSAELKKKGKQLFSLIAKINQEDNILVYTPSKKLKQSYDLDWGLAIARPAAVAFAAKQQLLLTLFLGTAATTLIVGTLAALLANRGMRPVLDAANAVDKIGQGELDTRVEVQGEDELAALATNINQMAGQLKVFVQEQELAAEQALLLAQVTGSRAVNSKELEDFLGDILEETRKLLNTDRVIFYRFNSDLSGYISGEAVAAGVPRALNSKLEDAFVPELLLESQLENNVLAINNIFDAGISLDYQRLLERLEIKAILEVLVLHEGQPYGLLIAHQCEVAHEWQDSQINFFKQLSAQMGLSLDRVILLERTEELLQQTGQLASEQQQLKEGLQQRALDLLKEVDPISKGDLTIRARVTADEIGTIADSYNATVGNLRKIVGQVQQAATQVAETTITNEASVQSLSAEALRQAEEIAQALNRAQEMAESVRQVAANAQLAETAVQQAAQTVQEGDRAMNRTVDGILTIRETVAETAKKVKHLGESSQKISTVVNLISTFAAQTNLLALNASIEAARAGEEGRGFAVVADEVRALARQSAEATSEIEKLVAAIQAETNEVVAAMEAGTEQVVTGTKLVEETRQSLNKITAASTQINELVESITQATVVQSKASEEVTKTMTNVATSADKTSKEASLVSSSFEQLLKVAQGLQQDVGRFKVS